MRGFSLIELMVTIAVAAILLGIAAPSFQDLVIRNRLATNANQLVTALNLARSEAIKRGTTVSVCKSANGSSCGGSGVNWESGWIVFVNNDDDSPAVVDPGEPILRVFPGIAAGYTLRPNTNFTNFLTYRADGTSNQWGRFVLCHNNTLNGSRAIFINSMGRPRLAGDSNSNGIPEDESGTDITTCTP